MRTLFDEYGVEYREYGDHLIPNVVLPKTDEIHIGVWAQRHKRYLKEHHRILYHNLLTKGELYDHLSDIEERAKTMYEDMIDALAEKEDINERLLELSGDPKIPQSLIRGIAMRYMIDDQSAL